MELRKIQSPKNKRGSIVDVGFILVAILGVGIFILIVAKVFPLITEQMQATEIGNNSASSEALDMTDTIAGSGDMIFIFIFAGLSISVLITSFFIDSSPILIPVYIIALGILIIFAVTVENVYEAFIDDVTFSTIALQHPRTNFIMSHLVMISIGIGVLSMILIFSKPRGGYRGAY